MVIIVCECFWWLRITLILFLAFNSQGPKALAEVQRGWHQKLRQLVKQPLSKGFLFAFQSIPNVPLFKLSKDTTLRYVLSVYIKILISWKIKKVETLGQFGCSDLSVENPYSFQDSLCDRTQTRHGRRARCTWRYFATARFEWPTKLSLFYPRNPRLEKNCDLLPITIERCNWNELENNKNMVEQWKVENHTSQFGLSDFLLGQVSMLHTTPFPKWRGIGWNKYDWLNMT